MKLRFLLVIPLFTFLTAFPFQCGVTRDGGVFKSLDMGETWQQKVTIDKKKDISRISILTIAFDPQDSKTVYLGTRSNGLYKTVNAGETWIKIEDTKGALDKRANIHDIAIDPTDTSRLYLAAYQDKRGRVFRSQDGGSSWEEVYVTDKEKYAIYAVAVDNYDPTIVFMGTAQGGFLKSTDYGKSWETMKWFDDVISDIAVNPQDTRIIYVSTFKKGIYKTTDEGKTWQSFQEALKEFRQAQNVEVLIIDAQRPNIIYAGSAYGLLRSTDSGQTWQAVNIVIPPKSMPVLSMTLDPQNSDHIFYGAGAIIYRSLDQGQNWTVYELSSKKTIKAIAIDPGDSNIIYAGMSEE